MFRVPQAPYSYGGELVSLGFRFPVEERKRHGSPAHVGEGGAFFVLTQCERWSSSRKHLPAGATFSLADYGSVLAPTNVEWVARRKFSKIMWQGISGGPRA